MIAHLMKRQRFLTRIQIPSAMSRTEEAATMMLGTVLKSTDMGVATSEPGQREHDGEHAEQKRHDSVRQERFHALRRSGALLSPSARSVASMPG